MTSNEKSKKIALTFDACMTTGMLKRIASGKDQPLDNAAIVAFLKQEKIQATTLSQDFGLKNIRRLSKSLPLIPFSKLATTLSATGLLQIAVSLFLPYHKTKKRGIYNCRKNY